MMWELLVVVVLVLFYWLIFGSPATIANTPFSLPLQILLDWTTTEPTNDIPHYHPWLAVGLSIVIVTVLILAIEVFIS